MEQPCLRVPFRAPLMTPLRLPSGFGGLKLRTWGFVGRGPACSGFRVQGLGCKSVSDGRCSESSPFLVG